MIDVIFKKNKKPLCKGAKENSQVNFSTERVICKLLTCKVHIKPIRNGAILTLVGPRDAMDSFYRDTNPVHKDAHVISRITGENPERVLATLKSLGWR